jgi:hypothetical protein
MRHLGLNLGFSLDFDFAQLAAQTNDVFRQFEQRALQAAHFTFDSGPGDGQLAGLVDQAVDQVGAHPQGGTLACCIGLRLSSPSPAGAMATGANAFTAGDGRPRAAPAALRANARRPAPACRNRTRFHR